MNIEAKNPSWKELYKIGAIAAILSEIVIFIGIVAYFIYPYAPGNQSTESIFLLLQENKLGGLISLDFHLVLGNLFGIILFLALYVSLKKVNPSYALIALVVGLVADILIIPARPISELFSLSGLFAAATTEVAKSQYLAAGEALLALFNGTSWFLKYPSWWLLPVDQFAAHASGQRFQQINRLCWNCHERCGLSLLCSMGWYALFIPLITRVHDMVFSTGPEISYIGTKQLTKRVSLRQASAVGKVHPL